MLSFINSQGVNPPAVQSLFIKKTTLVLAIHKSSAAYHTDKIIGNLTASYRLFLEIKNAPSCAF